ncbi:MAG: hypothetical protein MI923_19990 [Phycisphaerales bacterium]|nr:hypothetical protein [Phycisphaerales bacterium]
MKVEHAISIVAVGNLRRAQVRPQHRCRFLRHVPNRPIRSLIGEPASQQVRKIIPDRLCVSPSTFRVSSLYRHRRRSRVKIEGFRREARQFRSPKAGTDGHAVKHRSIRAANPYARSRASAAGAPRPRRGLFRRFDQGLQFLSGRVSALVATVDVLAHRC